MTVIDEFERMWQEAVPLPHLLRGSVVTGGPRLCMPNNETGFFGS